MWYYYKSIWYCVVCSIHPTQTHVVMHLPFVVYLLSNKTLQQDILLCGSILVYETKHCENGRLYWPWYKKVFALV